MGLRSVISQCILVSNDNAIADAVAKEATTKVLTNIHLRLTHSYIKNNRKRNIIKDWKLFWIASKKGG